MRFPSNQGIRLLKRPAPDKFNVDHYAVEVPAHLTWRLWKHIGSLIVELRPTGLVAVPIEQQTGWTATSTAENEIGATARLQEALVSANPYDLFQNNCEHFARYVIMGKPESTQVKGALLFAGLLLGVIWLAGAQGGGA